MSIKRGRPVPPFHLKKDETDYLRSLLRKRNLPSGEVRRARALLLLAQGKSHKEVAQMIGSCAQSVSTWRRRFLQEGLNGISEAPRPGAPRSISDEMVQEVITLTLESKPEDSTHWSTRTMAKKCGLSRTAVSRIWNAFGLSAHRTDSFQLSTDPLFVEKVRDVVGLYLSPPSNALVLCVDEKSQIQALERNQPILPMRQGIPERQSWDYWRHGTTSLFAALNVKTGEVLGKCYGRHRSREFLSFLREIEKTLPEQDAKNPYEVHLIMDNYVTHKSATVNRWLAKRPHWFRHYTPTYSSWLNQVERFFGIITQKKIRRGSFKSIKHLKDEIYAFLQNYNKDPKPFKWTADANLILGKVQYLCKELV